METLEQFLKRYAVLDGAHHMDGAWVPLSVAYMGAQLVLDGKKDIAKPSWIVEDKERAV